MNFDLNSLSMNNFERLICYFLIFNPNKKKMRSNTNPHIEGLVWFLFLKLFKKNIIMVFLKIILIFRFNVFYVFYIFFFKKKQTYHLYFSFCHGSTRSSSDGTHAMVSHKHFLETQPTTSYFISLY